jgi:hypothetical protein
MAAAPKAESGIQIQLAVPNDYMPITPEEQDAINERARRIRARVSMNNAFPTRAPIEVPVEVSKSN